ncbi:hypothetical protein B0H10DRAFT_2233283 [Mycena sp. CBHHK59/15]|nr:hypothetical protein B0H10DRAFT_2233283 [Mycena sp. CBHHK59/15]
MICWQTTELPLWGRHQGHASCEHFQHLVVEKMSQNQWWLVLPRDLCIHHVIRYYRVRGISSDDGETAEPALKRKRGRPSKASTAVDSGETEPADDVETAEPAPKRKRGRPSKALSRCRRRRKGMSRPMMEKLQSPAPKRKRRRPSKATTAVDGGEKELADDGETAEPALKRKRGRPCKASTAVDSGETEPADDVETAEPAPKRKRGRPFQGLSRCRRRRKETMEEPADDGETAEPAPKRKRGRPSKATTAVDGGEKEPADDGETAEPTPKRKRGRPSKDSIAVDVGTKELADDKLESRR